MDKKEFSDCLKHPEHIGRLNIQDLSNVLDKYPYFQTARFFKQKAMHVQKSPDFNAELCKIIQSVGSRDALYYFIYSLKEEIKTTKEEEIVENILPEVTIVAYAEPTDLIVFSNTFAEDTKTKSNDEIVDNQVTDHPDSMELNYQSTWSLNEDLVFEEGSLKEDIAIAKPFAHQELLDEFIKKIQRSHL